MTWIVAHAHTHTEEIAICSRDNNFFYDIALATTLINYCRVT